MDPIVYYCKRTTQIIYLSSLTHKKPFELKMLFIYVMLHCIKLFYTTVQCTQYLQFMLNQENM